MFPSKKIIKNTERKQTSVDLEELVEVSALKSVLVTGQLSDDSYVVKKMIASLATTADLNLKQQECEERLKNLMIFN